jgi:hypothetical protein
MSVAIDSLVVDCHDPAALARFWSAALDWPIEGNEFCVLTSRPKDDAQ